MEMQGMIDILFLASGVYLIYTAIVAKKREVVAANVMLGKNVKEKDIQDKAGFIEYMYKRIILAGTMIIAGSALHLVNDYYISSTELTLVGIGMILVALVIYTTAYMRGQKKYMVQNNEKKVKVK